MWWELLVVGGFWFWTVFSVFAVWFLWATWAEKGWPTTISIFLFLAVLTLFSDGEMHKWAYDNPINLLAAVGIYIAAGILWSIFKWYSLNIAIRRAYNRLLEKFKEGRKITGEIPDEQKQDWLLHLCRNIDHDEELNDYYNFKWSYVSEIETARDIIPKPSHYKPDLIFWLSYWPVSVLWYFLSDFIERLFKGIYEVFSNVYAWISKSVFKFLPE